MDTLFFFSIIITILISLCEAQSPFSSSCNGVFLSYNYTNGHPIPPTNSTNQPHRFESTLTVLNNGLDEVKSWRVFVGFQHDEVLVSATNAVLLGGDVSSLPASVGKNGSVFVGFPETDLKTAIETAGDLEQRQVVIQLVGTQVGVGVPRIPLPGNLTLANDGFNCPAPQLNGTEMHLCCMKDLNFKTNITLEEDFLPRQDGDLVIMYDVLRSYPTDYWAQVSISIHNPLARLDNWKLSWEWKRGEFIYGMKGAYPYVVDTSECLYGPPGQYYEQMDFSLALNCERNPTIVDLPKAKANDTNLGLIPFCCRNGTILPPQMDATRSSSAFQMHVYKLEPDLNRTELYPPQNFKINGTMNPDYQCGQPIRVSPSLHPDPSGLSSGVAAAASWQVICNVTESKRAIPKCCVSFSAFFNDSAVPCDTCACGCNTNPRQTCSATTPALLHQPGSLIIPYENRTKVMLSWADLKHLSVPNPLPCPDNCGVSINWHVATDHKDGWTAKLTLFNWGETEFEDWFAAVELDKAVAGFEKTYSINGSVINNTVFMKGLPGLNYLLPEREGDNPKKDPRVPGLQQSVILFKKKKNTPRIHVPLDGFPTRVLFNGAECAIPRTLPSNGHMTRTATWVVSILTLLVLFL